MNHKYIIIFFLRIYTLFPSPIKISFVIQTIHKRHFLYLGFVFTHYRQNVMENIAATTRGKGEDRRFTDIPGKATILKCGSETATPWDKITYRSSFVQCKHQFKGSSLLFLYSIFFVSKNVNILEVPCLRY